HGATLPSRRAAGQPQPIQEPAPAGRDDPSVHDAPGETAPGRCGGGNPGPSIFAGLQTRPTTRILANGYLRSLKVISENPLISINEAEKIAARRPAGLLEHQRRAVRALRADDQLLHPLRGERS